MNNKVIGVLMFVLGAAVGVLGTYKIFKTKYEQIAQEEIDSVKETFAKHNESQTFINEGEVGGDPTSIQEIYATTEETFGDQTGKKNMIYRKPNPKRHKAYNKELIKVNTVTPEQIEERDPEIPYVITLEEWEEISEDKTYEKLELSYFAEDDTLCDDHEEMLPESAMLLGYDFVEHFGNGSDDPCTVFIRNEKMGCDFEVTWNSGSYQEIVLGVTPPKPVAPRKKKIKNGDD